MIASVTPDTIGAPPRPVWTAYVDTEPPTSFVGPDPLYAALRLCEVLASRPGPDDDTRLEPAVWVGDETGVDDSDQVVIVLRVRKRDGHPLVSDVHDPEDPADVDVVLTTLYSLGVTEKLALDLPEL